MTTTRVIPIAPACFASRDQWCEFIASAEAVKPGADAAPRPWLADGSWNPLFSPCADCTQAYEAEMVRASRCHRGAFTWTPRSAQGSLLETA